MRKIKRPAIGDFPEFYRRYVEACKGEDLIVELEESHEVLREIVHNLPKDKELYRYEEGKWNIKELIVHLTDSERIFLYRALRFARKDKSPLVGFDENEYVAALEIDHLSMKEILANYQLARLNTIGFYMSMAPELLELSGTANGVEMTVATIGYVCLGHELHHTKIIQERYL